MPKGAKIVLASEKGKVAESNPFISITPPLSSIFAPRRKVGKLVTSVNLDYSDPMVSVHEDYMNEPEVKQKLVKHFYYLTLDKWLYSEDYESVLNMFTVKGKNVFIGKNTSEKNTKDKSRISEYVERKILSKKKMKKILKQYISKKRLNWVDLVDEKSSLKHFVKKKLKSLINEKKY